MIEKSKAASAGNTKRLRKKTIESSRGDFNTISIWDAIEAFQQVLQDNGLGRPDIKPDAGIQRFKLDTDKGNAKSGWYTFHSCGDIFAGGFGNWKNSLTSTWNYKKDNKPLSDVERQKLTLVYAEAKKKRIAEQEKRYAQARRFANGVINSSTLASPEHPYLVKKHCIEAAKYLRQDKKGNLLIPLYNEKRLVSLQYINKNGGKFFAKGGQLKGAYFLFGDSKKLFDTIYIVEGVSTGWTVHTLADKSLTFCAMNASNLINVALNVRKRWPKVSIIICADNDVREDSSMSNTGVEAAKEAALAVNGCISIPSMPDGSSCDFNDLLVLSIESQKNNGVKS